MSHLVAKTVRCPHCAALHRASIFESVNGDLVPDEVIAICEGRFELQRCALCSATFVPQHEMLFVQLSHSAWLVMHPLADRRRFATIERGVELVLEARFREADPHVTARLRALRPRLVFGQHQLRDAVLCVQAGLDPTLVEALKLGVYRRELARMLAYGPSELALERVGDALVFGVFSLPDGARVDELVLPRDELSTAPALRDALAASHPGLFDRPYLAMSRVLYAAQV